MYAQLERKEVRVRADQLADLADIVRTLMRTRHVKTERITENTLIRIAIDLLIARRDDLRGGTEQQLRRSVTPEVRQPDSSRPRTTGRAGVSEPGASAVPASDAPGPFRSGIR